MADMKTKTPKLVRSKLKSAASGRDTVPGFKERLTAARLDADMDMTQLAAAVGVPYATIHRLESGVRTPSFRMAALLAEALGCEVTKFLPPKAAGKPAK